MTRETSSACSSLPFSATATAVRTSCVCPCNCRSISTALAGDVGFSNIVPCKTTVVSAARITSPGARATTTWAFARDSLVT